MNHGFTGWERGLARILLLCFLTTTSLPARSQQWEDPNGATFGDDVSLENSDDGLKTEFTIDSTRTTIGWGDLQQPENNTLIFTFSSPNDDSAVLNEIDAPHPSALNGSVECLGGTCAFVNPYGIYVGDEAILDVGDLALISGTIDQQEFLANGTLDSVLEGHTWVDGQILAEGNVLLLGREVTNRGDIQVANGALLMLAGHEISDLEWDALQNDSLARAEFSADLGGGLVQNFGRIGAPDAALIGQRAMNYGEILVEDGAVLMVAADGVWVRRFDEPVSIRFPRPQAESSPDEASGSESVLVDYAVENHGRIDAGLGHVRLSAADPLGYAIRQGTTGSISARQVDVAGGENGRVHLSGEIDAIPDPETGIGGRVDITGNVIALVDADIDASGPGGGGQIQIGGEQEGRGELQRAQAVVVDEDSEVRADALDEGDGGRVIVFSETLTSVDGELSARGGAEGGDGGFIETSGHRRFAITETPDVSAPRGQAGDWLIDPFDIEVVADGIPGGACTTGSPACLDSAIEAILDPDFDDSVFDGIIRTLTENSQVEATTIAKALGVGTNVTLSTQVFGSRSGDQAGDITISAPITIDNADTLAGTAASLTLLAAGDINVDSAITSGTVGQDPNLALSVFLIANDPSQNSFTDAFSYDLIRGDVVINSNIETGGGDFDAQGAAVHLAAGQSIETFGGNVDIRSGSLDANGNPIDIGRGPGTPGLNAGLGDPVDGNPFDSPSSSALPVAITIEGDIDTSRSGSTGGNVNLLASAMNVATGTRIDSAPGLLAVASGATITTGGGSLTMSGGGQDGSGNVFAGNVSVEGDLNTCRLGASCLGSAVGGDLSVTALHPDPTTDIYFYEVEPSPAPGAERNEGGEILLDVSTTSGVETGGGTLSIGSDLTRSVLMDGQFRTDGVGLAGQQGLVRLVARDALGANAGDSFGEATIGIGTTGTTTIRTGGLDIEGREITTSNETTPQTVTLFARGDTSQTLEGVERDTIQIQGTKSIDLGAGTSLVSERIEIHAATQPQDQTEAERGALSPALQFRGSNAPGQVGVLLDAPVIDVRSGDGTTATASLFVSPDELVQNGLPTNLALERGATANYAGLQLRSGATRPDEVTIAQDADFTISGNPLVADSELDLESAFGGAAFGADGLALTLESSDGTLFVEDAAGMNGANSHVVLQGGLLLPPTPPTGAPAPDTVTTENSVVLGDGVSPLVGSAAFDVDTLIVSTPGDYTLTAQAADSITSANGLVFEAGRNTGATNAAGRGDLIVDGSGGPILLDDATRLSLLAGASGFGDLVFDTTPTTTIWANELNLRAGAGSSSLNEDAATRSRITGLTTGVVIRDELGNAFGSEASPPGADFRFGYRQDAGIDAQTDLPSLLQFGLTPASGFRDARDVVYSVRSDQASIDLDDGTPGTNEAEQFRDAALELVSSDPLQISDDFRFIGDSIVLGGVLDFQFTQALATAFNDTANNPDSEMTLRSGLGASGDLFFEANVPVVASRIDLIAGDGEGGETGSTIDVGGAQFDLSAATGDRIFVLHQDESIFSVAELPDIDQFVGGLAGAPDIFVLRSDSGVIDLSNIDFTTLPIDSAGDTRRFVLEADEVRLSQVDDANPNLDLVAPNGLRLRLRANELVLSAADGALDETGGRVLAGATNSVITGVDGDFDAVDLLIEAFDPESEFATVTNLSVLSADPGTPGEFDLSDTNGRGPRTLTTVQNGTVALADLPDETVFSGQLNRSLEEDADGIDVPTRYPIQSQFGSISIDNGKVDGSSLFLQGVSDSATSDDRAFDFASDDYVLADLTAQTQDSIVIREGTTFDVENRILLAAGLLDDQRDAPVTSALPGIEFETGSGPSIELSANRISLVAGTAFALTEPDGADDGAERDEIDDAFLPRVDLGGISVVNQTGGTEGSFFDVEQNASVDVDAAIVAALVAGTGQFDVVEFESIQGDASIVGLGQLDLAAESLNVRAGPDGAIVADLGTTGDPFDDYVDGVVLRSDDITLRTEVAGVQLDLASSKLQLRSTVTEADLAFPDNPDQRRLRSDPDSLERPIVRIEQVDDFAASGSLPTLAQYAIELGSVNADGTVSENAVQRETLSNVDLELRTTGASETLTLDDDVRDAAFDSNLILRSAARVAIDLSGAAPGYDGIEAAALSLQTLDIGTDTDSVGNDGEILFSIAAFPTSEQMDLGPDRIPADVSTVGDQKIEGTFTLQTDLTLRGRNIRFVGNVETDSGSGLTVDTSGTTTFEGNIGTLANRLDFLQVLFDQDSLQTPIVEFGERDEDGAPIASLQEVLVRGDIVFAGKSDTGVGFSPRSPGSLIATVGKAEGDLTIDSSEGAITMGVGEHVAVGGNLVLAAEDATNGVVTLSDVAALDLVVRSPSIRLQRRASGLITDSTGGTRSDGGPSILANAILFVDENGNEQVPTIIGSGARTIFGIPNPFDTAGFPDFLDDFALFQIKANGQPLLLGDFDLNGIVPAFAPNGASRSDLSTALGPFEIPSPNRLIPAPKRVQNPDRLAALGVEVHPTRTEVSAARLQGDAVIDDLGVEPDESSVYVSESRLDAEDAEEAIELYEKIFGTEDDRADSVRTVLQDALDSYLEDTRTRRVIGFELRRFVKNRPSTLLAAYQTLDDLDDLFRFHRRLGLSPSEYRSIQRSWLERIQPEGITLDELSEAIHPSRYVRGSDILDIFGR